MKVIIQKKQDGRYCSFITDNPEWHTKKSAEALIEQEYEEQDRAKVLSIFDLLADNPRVNSALNSILQALAELDSGDGYCLERLMDLAMKAVADDRR